MLSEKEVCPTVERGSGGDKMVGEEEESGLLCGPCSGLGTHLSYVYTYTLLQALYYDTYCIV